MLSSKPAAAAVKIGAASQVGRSACPAARPAARPLVHRYSQARRQAWHRHSRTCCRSHMRQSTRWQRLRCSAKAMRSSGAGLNLTLRQACGTEAVQRRYRGGTEAVQGGTGASGRGGKKPAWAPTPTRLAPGTRASGTAVGRPGVACSTSRAEARTRASGGRASRTASACGRCGAAVHGGAGELCVAGGGGLPHPHHWSAPCHKFCTPLALRLGCCCGAAKALDVFLQSMVDGAAQVAEGRGARMVTPSHM